LQIISVWGLYCSMLRAKIARICCVQILHATIAHETKSSAETCSYLSTLSSNKRVLSTCPAVWWLWCWLSMLLDSSSPDDRHCCCCCCCWTGDVTSALRTANHSSRLSSAVKFDFGAGIWPEKHHKDKQMLYTVLSCVSYRFINYPRRCVGKVISDVAVTLCVCVCVCWYPCSKTKTT